MLSVMGVKTGRDGIGFGEWGRVHRGLQADQHQCQMFAPSVAGRAGDRPLEAFSPF